MRTMKDSGIEWIGKIPENWNESPLKSRYSFGKGLSITKADLSDEGAQVISYGQIHSKDNNGVSTKEEIIRHIPWNHSNLTSTARTQPGDLIFADTLNTRRNTFNSKGIVFSRHSVTLCIFRLFFPCISPIFL